ncbi:MAG: alpha/beta hydrolase, partial [Flavobacteriaceae bacterium]
MKFPLIAIVFIISISSCKSQERDGNGQLIKESITYKKIGNTFLKLYLFTSNKEDKKPVIVFFHPGGWVSGSPSFFFEKAEAFSSLGYTTICVQYRLADLKTTTPKDCLNDSKDALRYLKENEEKLCLDMSMLFLVGYSAGGHLALMTQLNTGESIPMANKIFTIASPVDLTEDELLKTSMMTANEKIALSPTNHIKHLKTKLYLFNGTNDEYIDYSTISNFSNKAEKMDKKVELTAFK